MRQITAVKRKTAVAVLHFDGVDPEVTLLLGREFLGLGIKGKSTLLQGVIGVSRKAAVIAADQVAEILIPDRSAIVEMIHVIKISDLKLVSGPGGMQGKGLFLLVVNNGHVDSSKYCFWLFLSVLGKEFRKYPFAVYNFIVA